MLERIAHFDEQLFLAMNNGLRSTLGDLAFGYPTWLGEGFVLVPLCLTVLYWRDRTHFKRNAVWLVGVIVVVSLFNHAIKEYVERLRPLAKFHGWKGPGFWNPGIEESYTVMFKPLMYNSFPSGHCASFASAAVFLSLLFRKLAPFLSILTVIVMISRVYVGAHFPLDTVAGAALGAGAAFLAFMLYTRYNPVSLRGDAGAVKRTRL